MNIKNPIVDEPVNAILGILPGQYGLEVSDMMSIPTGSRESKYLCGDCEVLNNKDGCVSGDEKYKMFSMKKMEYNKMWLHLEYKQYNRKLAKYVRDNCPSALNSVVLLSCGGNCASLQSRSTLVRP